jgi:hypothetical protein
MTYRYSGPRSGFIWTTLKQQQSFPSQRSVLLKIQLFWGVDFQIVTDVSADHGAFIFKATQCSWSVVTSRNGVASEKTRIFNVYLGAFSKLQKTSVSFVMSVHSSVRLSIRMEQLVSHWTDFDKIQYYSFFFRKSVEKIQVSLKSYKNNGYFT